MSARIFRLEDTMRTTKYKGQLWRNERHYFVVASATPDLSTPVRASSVCVSGSNVRPSIAIPYYCSSRSAMLRSPLRDKRCSCLPRCWISAQVAMLTCHACDSPTCHLAFHHAHAAKALHAGLPGPWNARLCECMMLRTIQKKTAIARNLDR